MTMPDYLAPQLGDRLLAGASLAMLTVATFALSRAGVRWQAEPLAVWVHLGTVGIALGLTPVMLLRQRGDRLHRLLGWIWASAMFATAAASLAIRQINHGQFSVIHLLSIWTLLMIPRIVWMARKGDTIRHRRGVRGLVLGGLILAGVFTFTPGRLLGYGLLSAAYGSPPAGTPAQ